MAGATGRAGDAYPWPTPGHVWVIVLGLDHLENVFFLGLLLSNYILYFSFTGVTGERGHIYFGYPANVLRSNLTIVTYAVIYDNSSRFLIKK